MRNFHKILIATILSGVLISNGNAHSETSLIIGDTLSEGPIVIESFPCEILSPSAGVQFFREGFVYLSDTRNHASISSKHLSFGRKLAYFSAVVDSLSPDADVFAENFSYPCEAIAFNVTWDSMYYTKIGAGGKEKLFRAVFSSSENKWIYEPEALTICTDNFIYTHPVISKDGNILVFSSDMEGGNGKLDLYYCIKSGGEWSNPVNLGNRINTSGSEVFAELDKDKNLYFSSDKLPGFGGFDIYFAAWNGQNWDPPFNLSQIINSGKNEIAFKLSPSNYTGFLSIMGNDNADKPELYSIHIADPYWNIYSSLSEILMNFARLEGAVTEAELTAEDYNMQTDISPGRHSDPDSISVPVEIPSVDSAKEMNVDQETVKLDTEFSDTLKLKDITVTIEEEETALTDTITVPIPAEPVLPEAETEVVIYRVQFASSSSSKGRYAISIEGEEFQTWEYYYKGAYRQTVGSFSNLSDAVGLQSKCRNSGYSQAFVVVFVNDVRSLDSKYFKK